LYLQYFNLKSIAEPMGGAEKILRVYGRAPAVVAAHTAHSAPETDRRAPLRREKTALSGTLKFVAGIGQNRALKGQGRRKAQSAPALAADREGAQSGEVSALLGVEIRRQPVGGIV
jgi:hypothetical protein